MAVVRPKLTSSQESSLLAICAIGAAGLSRVVDKLSNTKLLINAVHIRSLIVAEVGDVDGEHLASFLFGIAVANRRDPESDDSALENLSAVVEGQIDREPRFAGWPSCRPLLAELLKSPSIRASTKAMDVSYDFERIYVDGRFLTSVRPIYDSERTDIIAATIVQTFRLEFMSSEGERATMSMAVDKSDIVRLRDLCEAAIRKADVAFNKVSEKWSLPTIMPGEDFDE
jgi:hypothetical protein